MTESLPDRLRVLAARVDAALDEVLAPESEAPETLHRAMRYSVYAGGKRVRPILAMLAAEALGMPIDGSVHAASALELIHTYSLVHDDLPAMDDDDLRRGRPTSHKVFGEATAILAGDALLTLAFEVLAAHPRGDGMAGVRGEAVALVARAAGHRGMVGGQEMDLRAEGRAPDIDTLEAIHRRKTGALLEASVSLGAVLARADEGVRAALQGYGRSVGMAFQITDDVLDVSGSASGLGKTPGKDARAGKVTYPALMGLEASRRKALQLSREAVDAVASLGAGGHWLREMARFVVERMH